MLPVVRIWGRAVVGLDHGFLAGLGRRVFLSEPWPGPSASLPIRSSFDFELIDDRACGG